jgi:hypothetical protein
MVWRKERKILNLLFLKVKRRRKNNWLGVFGSHITLDQRGHISHVSIKWDKFLANQKLNLFVKFLCKDGYFVLLYFGYLWG